MKQWLVWKTGHPTFDVTHAYGVTIVVNYVTRAATLLMDAGMYYDVQTPVDQIPFRSADFPIELLSIPKNTNPAVASAIELDTLDGLLAATATFPGVRVFSIDDANRKERTTPGTVRRSGQKVVTKVEALLKFANRSFRKDQDILSRILKLYEPDQPTIPLPRVKRQLDIAVPMPIEPAFGFAGRREWSDGVNVGVNVSFEGNLVAPLLAYIGASRFLRAQCVDGDRVNLYVPLPNRVLFTPLTRVERLSGSKHNSQQSLALHLLNYPEWIEGSHDVQMSGVVYQTLQTQGVQQSISIAHGTVMVDKLQRLEEDVGPQLRRYWRGILWRDPGELNIEIDLLVAAILSFDYSDWHRHLLDYSAALHSESVQSLRPYTLRELQAMMQLSDPQNVQSLSSVLRREGGTLRIGHAMRLLGRQKPQALREILEEMEAVNTTASLLRMLQKLAQECELAIADSEFIIVPTDPDLADLLDDIDTFGLRDIVMLLMVLSALRYPKLQDSNDGATQEKENISESIEGDIDNERIEESV